MNVLRRILGLLVMLAGVLGLVLSLAGLLGIWMAKPTVEVYAGSAIDALSESLATSQEFMAIAGQSLAATIDSIDDLSEMLVTAAATLETTKPAIDDVHAIMSETLPSTLAAATDSLHAAQDAARVLERTIQQLDAFRFLLAEAPLVGGFLQQSGEAYNPDKPLADSLGAVAGSLQELPGTFVDMSADLGATEEKLVALQRNLETMSSNVARISEGLAEYQAMIAQSQSSTEELATMLTGIRGNLGTVLNGVAIVLSLLFLWLLAAQIVILSQGWELYQGTASRMEKGDEKVNHSGGNHTSA
jgi:hypothetical protein